MDPISLTRRTREPSSRPTTTGSIAATKLVDTYGSYFAIARSCTDKTPVIWCSLMVQANVGVMLMDRTCETKRGGDSTWKSITRANRKIQNGRLAARDGTMDTARLAGEGRWERSSSEGSSACFAEFMTHVFVAFWNQSRRPRRLPPVTSRHHDDATIERPV